MVRWFCKIPLRTSHLLPLFSISAECIGIFSRVLMIRESYVLQFWWWCIQFSWAKRILFTFESSLLFLPKFPVGLINLLLSLHLGIFNFGVWARTTPSFLWLGPTFTRLTRDPDLCGETSSLHWPCITTLVALAFATGDLSLEFVSCPRFDMAPITQRWLVWQRERKLLRWLPECVGQLMMLNKHKRWFHSSLEKLPLVRMSASWFWVST